MKTPRHKQVLEKSVAACVAGIEVYNKPDFLYREEVFAILMVNAWELLLKAQILKLNKNSLRSIHDLERKTRKNGKKSLRLTTKLNRAGNPRTIDLYQAVERLRQQSHSLDERCLENINLLVEVRDNAIHFFNRGIGLSARIRDIGTASLRNYMYLVQDWFHFDLSRYNFYLMPLSFFHASDVVASFSVEKPNAQTRNLLSYLSDSESRYPSDESQSYNVSLQLETRLVRTRSPEAIAVAMTSDRGAPHITYSVEDMLLRFPLRYDELVRKLRHRYSDFLQNQEFHDLMKVLEADDERYCHRRPLDPAKPQSTHKKFYSTEVFKALDPHYTRKKTG